LNESARLVFGGGVNNADPINNGGLGTVVLLASGSTSSGWTVYGGPLNLQTGGALGSGPVTFWFGGSLQLQGGITIPNALSNDVSVESVSGNNTLTGPITLFHAGSFRVAPASTLIVSTNPITFTTSGVNLQVVVDGALTISSSIQGPGGLTKGGHIGEATGGTGPLTLSGANTYVGQTTVAVGPLLVTGNQPNSPVFVSQGATLGGTGTTGPITVGGTVAPG